MKMDKETKDWIWTFNHPGPVARQSPLEIGHFFLPPDVDDKSAATRKIGWKRLAVLCAVVVLVVGAICLLAWDRTPEAVPLPLLAQLQTAMGMTAEEAAGTLERQLVQVDTGVYKVDGGCEYLDVQLDVYLYFEENEDLLQAFAYQAQYEADGKTAARDLAKVAYQMGVKMDGVEEERVKRSELKELFADGEGVALSQTGSLSGDDIAYISYLENADYYEGRVGEFLTKHAYCYRDTTLEYAPDTGEVSMQIRFCVEADRAK